MEAAYEAKGVPGRAALMRGSAVAGDQEWSPPEIKAENR
jgi:hypothetical protein